MIRKVILPISVVLLAASGYSNAQNPKQDADRCSPGLGDYITRVCSSYGAKFIGFSECSYTCDRQQSNGQTSWTKHNLPDGLPCGKCKECCVGICTPINFNFGNPLSLKSCAK
uniref:Putative ixostatin n=1 Tax=Ixodes ricinus TaxID=34613 RepID=A0A0K8RC86_IXORI